MENSIVKDFQNLRVLSSYDFERMDQLVQDLTNALEETTRQQKGAVPASTLPRKCKKRRSRKYRISTCSKTTTGNISEASESSLDERLLKDYIETIVQHSDSDELHMLTAAQKLNPAFPLLPPFPSCPISIAESDSVNENFSPMRPHRRRRRFKRMAVDPNPELDCALDTGKGTGAGRSKPVTPPPTPDDLMDSDSKVLSDVTPGKRKRAMRDKSFDLETLPGCEQGATGGQGVDRPTGREVEVSSSSSSCLSSSESELSGLFTNDEGREGDDEHSDFYYEYDGAAACGIPGIVPWWDGDKLGGMEQQQDSSDHDAQFEAILTGSFHYMSALAKHNFRHRLKMLAKPDREIRSAQRRLKDRKPAYSLSRFIQDRQQWRDNLEIGRSPTTRPSCSGTNLQAHDHKRRRKTPPVSPNEDVTSGEMGGQATVPERMAAQSGAPIPESNVGNRLLQNMGWNPGSGLGRDGAGIVTPVVAYKRNGRAGLGTPL